jgi:DNA-binding IclR family transcriptional regulator
MTDLQTLDRAVQLLRCLGNSGQQGLRLIDIQRELKLKRPTAHRIVTSLLQHGLVVRDGNSRGYRLGWELAVLGWSVASSGIDLRKLAQEATSRLAEETGDTVILSARSGLSMVCIDRQSGAYPIKVFTIEVGARRPLGVGAGSIAVLAAMSEEESAAALGAVTADLAAYPHVSRAAVEKAVRAARSAGYAVSHGTVLPNVRGVAVAIRDARGSALGSIGIAAIADRATAERLPQIGRLLLREQARLDRAVHEAALGRSG